MPTTNVPSVPGPLGRKGLRQNVVQELQSVGARAGLLHLLRPRQRIVEPNSLVTHLFTYCGVGREKGLEASSKKKRNKYNTIAGETEKRADATR